VLDDDPVPVGPQRLVGDYALYDDGWRCGLALRWSENRLESRFISYDRTAGRFDSSITVDGNRVELTVHGFNELDVSRYTGYVSGRGPVVIAGSGDWKGTPFGFYARHEPPRSAGPDIPGALRPAAYLGGYTVHCEDRLADLLLTSVDGSTLRGRLIQRGVGEFAVTGVVDAVVAHLVTFTVHDTPVVITALMFVRARSAMAGWLDRDGQRFGCHLTRFASHESILREESP
jgi:hypothetical protein